MLLILAPVPLLFGVAVILVPATLFAVEMSPRSQLAFEPFLNIWRAIETRVAAFAKLLRRVLPRPAAQPAPHQPAPRVAWPVLLRSFGAC